MISGNNAVSNNSIFAAIEDKVTSAKAVLNKADSTYEELVKAGEELKTEVDRLKESVSILGIESGELGVSRISTRNESNLNDKTVYWVYLKENSVFGEDTDILKVFKFNISQDATIKAKKLDDCYLITISNDKTYMVQYYLLYVEKYYDDEWEG